VAGRPLANRPPPGSRRSIRDERFPVVGCDRARSGAAGRTEVSRRAGGVSMGSWECPERRFGPSDVLSWRGTALSHADFTHALSPDPGSPRPLRPPPRRTVGRLGGGAPLASRVRCGGNRSGRPSPGEPVEAGPRVVARDRERPPPRDGFSRATRARARDGGVTAAARDAVGGPESAAANAAGRLGRSHPHRLGMESMAGPGGPTIGGRAGGPRRVLARRRDSERRFDPGSHTRRVSSPAGSPAACSRLAWPRGAPRFPSVERLDSGANGGGADYFDAGRMTVTTVRSFHSGPPAGDSR
jgi:hypothetical protein